MKIDNSFFILFPTL